MSVRATILGGMSTASDGYPARSARSATPAMPARSATPATPAGPARFAGVVTAAELAAAGWTPADIKRHVRRGLLTPLGRGVYARSDLLKRASAIPKGQHLVRIAAVLAVSGPDAVASHQTAATMHGLDLMGGMGSGVTLTVPPGTRGSRAARPGVRVHAAGMPASHVVVIGGCRVTAVHRTVVDLSRILPFREGVVTADSALRRKKSEKAAIARVIADCARWPGAAKARQVLEFSDCRAESPLESIARVAFRDAGLPRPDLQAWVGGGGMIAGRCDFLWQQYGTIGEADGAIKYADPSRAMAQLSRDARLREAGFQVVHFTWWDITHVPDLVAARIRAAFARAGAA